ncbi:MAG: UvrB/UvrC motif-containing protein, partial [Candidatus Margulisbacteria bacterium]|nr:UvrB/UvrC motif-containing protein [Candidatus Margulisiibacteriota bacterium]
DSMKKALKETARRRKLQIAYNIKHNITPRTIVKEIADISEAIRESKLAEIKNIKKFVPEKEIPDLITSLEEQMHIAATALEFEQAAELRDRIGALKKVFKLK